jgi:hypothetical protein
MSSEAYLILEVIPPGTGVVLDLGGSTGMLRSPIEASGYRYINLDVRRLENGEPSLWATHRAIQRCHWTWWCKDTLEHFLDPGCGERSASGLKEQGGYHLGPLYVSLPRR